jgi:hypothetical protein
LTCNPRDQVRDQAKKSKDGALEFKVFETVDGTKRPVSTPGRAFGLSFSVPYIKMALKFTQMKRLYEFEINL